MRRRPLKYSVALATVIAGVTAVPAQAADTFSCRASAAKVNALGLVLEPFVANRPDVPCKDDSASVLTPTTIGPLRAAVINAKTDADPGGAPGASADAQVTGARIAAVGLPLITADVLHSTAGAKCVGGAPVLSDSSVVANVRVGGLLINVPGGNAIVTYTIPLVGKLYINERVVSGGRVTRRALRLDTLLIDVVVAESTANVEGSPCAAAPRPQCSDEIDNGDPEDTLIDAADPGCHSDGNPNNPGSYVPSDDDETDKPQCSNGGDDDGDTFVDGADPGCHSDGDPNNPGSYVPSDDDETDVPRPECSDGIDNADPEDELIDAADPACHTDANPNNPDSYVPTHYSEVNGPNPACSNGADDDGDKFVDADDPGCHSDGNPGNPGSYDPYDPSEANPACIDGQDNDGDKFVDEDDPGCHSDGDPTNKASYLPGNNES